MRTSAKRALDFGGGTPAKRRRTTTVILRGSKNEMKTQANGITHSSTTGSNTILGVDQGTGNDDRIGSKAKVWRITGYLVGQTPMRVELVMPNDAADVSPTYGFGDDPDRRTYNILQTWTFAPQTTSTSHIYTVNYKFPMGIIQRYDGTTATDLVSHALLMRIITPSATTVTGAFRMWYTDP